MKKLYSGSGDDTSVTVLVIDVAATGHREVRHLTHHVHHSPGGFAWGYGGSGPAELARCILWDHTGTEPHPATYQAFKETFVARWPWPGDWTLRAEIIEEWFARRTPSVLEVDAAFWDMVRGEEAGR